MNPLHEQFIAEARELLAQTSDDLIALERDGFAAEGVERVFRAFHTLKGSAGVVDMPAMALVMHAAEDVIAALKSGKLALGEAVISQGLACLDQVSQWVDAFEADGALPPQAGDDARRLADSIRRQLSPPAERFAMPPPGEAIPDWARQLVVSQRDAIAERLGSGSGAIYAVAYRPREQCFLDGDDPLSLLRQIPHLLALNLGTRRQGPLAELDPFACYLDIHALAAGDRHELSTIFRLVPDQVEIVDVSALLLQARPPASRRTQPDLVAAILQEQCEVLRVAGAGDDLSGRIGACGRVAANALYHLGRSGMADRIAAAARVATDGRDAAPLLAAIADVRSILVSGPEDLDDIVAEPTPSGRQAEADSATGRWLRVDEAHVDALVNLAGELIILKNSFAHLARRIEEESASLELSSAAKSEYAGIERLTGNLHDAILRLRMVPIGQVFRAFPRLARDLSQRLGKKVQLVIHGETLETDKAIADRLFEPLLHLVRNAIDHGIEGPERRKAAGKPETAVVTLQASRVGDRISIEVRDDGRGINPAAVRRKAGESGLLPADQLAALSDEEALRLIFSAGFSTAEYISDVSGRGVGMDVVRTAIDQIGGRVSITSQVGTGTAVRLDVPVNIATSRIMVIECDGQVFGIPMDAVTETIRLDHDRIRRVKNNEAFVLRDRVVPICSLAELIKLSPRSNPSAKRLVMAVEVNGKTIAVEVDAIRDRLDVVLKPMQGLLADARGYAGTTLLGDGSVLLVLDVKELLA